MFEGLVESAMEQHGDFEHEIESYSVDYSSGEYGSIDFDVIVRTEDKKIKVVLRIEVDSIEELKDK